MTMVIRKATINDSEELAHVGKVTFVDSHGHSAAKADIDAYVASKYTPEIVLEDLAKPENIYHVATVDGRITGYSKIIFNAAHEYVQTPHATKLERLYALKDFHGRGIGPQLFDWNVKLSRDAGQSGLWLYTWVENHRAVAFYKKVGFEIVGLADFQISPTHSNPNHIMWRPH